MFKVAGLAKTLASRESEQGDELATRAAAAPSDASMAPLNALLSLLRGLRDADEDGRVIVEAESAKYCLLNPGKHFAKAWLSSGGGGVAVRCASPVQVPAL